MEAKTVSAKRFFVCNILIYFSMYPAALFFLVFLSILPLSEAIKLFLNGAGLSSLLFVLIVPAVLYNWIMKKLNAFREQKISVEEVNKAVKLYELFSIVLPVISPLIQPFFMCRLYGAYKTPFLTPSIILVFMSATFLFSLFFYILYIQSFEKYISFVPLLEKYRSMPLVVRSVLVGTFSFTAVTSIFIAPLLVPLRTGSGIDSSLIERILILAVCGSLIGVGDIYLQINGAASRVKRIMGFTSEVAAGNYRCSKLEVTSRDEFGLLVNDLNLFYANTRSLLGSLSSNVEVSQITAEELTKSMSEAEKSVQQISVNISDVAAQVSLQSGGVFETQNTIGDITGNIQNLNTNIDKQAVQVAQSSAAIEEMVANVQSVTGIVEKNMSTVSSLGKAAESGKETVSDTVQITRRMIDASEGLLETSTVIQNIASQTNLLAMNAAIEAAHAGDVGAGFAVVADEIRKLAEDSNQQGKTITAVMKELIDAIHEVDVSANTVQKEFDEISTLTDTVENQEKIVINAMQEQCMAGEQVLEAIRQMNEITAEVKTGSEQMRKGSETVASEMRNLVAVTEKITKSTQIMSEETEQIQRQIQNVSVSSQKNHEVVQTVAQEMGKFRI